MFYVNKRDREEVVELIHSEQGIVIVVDQQDTLKSGNPVGRIMKIGKKQFKKDFKKAPEKLIKMDLINDAQKEEIINTFITDRYGLINHSEEYIENMKKKDRAEYFNGLTDSEYEESLEQYADPVVSKKHVNRKDLLRAKEALQNNE